MDRRVTTQDISWFLDLHRNEQLELNPSYQRRSVWSTKDRRYFLDTIFRGYPSPSIFLHKKIGENGQQIYDVVDGKQRLETILKFVNNNIYIDKEFGDTALNGKKWKNLDSDQKKQFWDYVLPVEFIQVIEGTVINQVFERLNRNSRRLERQELRHAKYEGWFINYAENEASSNYWTDLKISTTSRAKRMKDIQFISELCVVIIDRKIEGFDQDGLDALYADLETVEESTRFINISIFEEDMQKAKAHIQAMEEHNACITTYATSYTHFYSLWAAIALSGSTNKSQEDAEAYSQFMNSVEEIKENIEEHIQSEIDKKLVNPLKYYQNSTGASTEEPQRKERHSTLLKALSR